MSNLSNPAGALAEDAQYGPVTITVVAANSISAGEVVALSTSAGFGIRNLVATAAGKQVGIALRDIPSGKSGVVVIGGFALAKKGSAALTAGNAVKADPTVSGAVGVASAATAITQVGDARGLIGTVVADQSAGDATVLIFVGKI